MATVNLSEETMTTEQAAKYMGLSIDTVRKYIQRGLLETSRFGHVHVITKRECDRYLRERLPRGNPNLPRKSGSK